MPRSKQPEPTDPQFTTPPPDGDADGLPEAVTAYEERPYYTALEQDLADRIAPNGMSVAGTLRGSPALRTTERTVTLRRPESEPRAMDSLWWAINVHSEAISFRRYSEFLDGVCAAVGGLDRNRLAARAGVSDLEIRDLPANSANLIRHIPGADLYQFLKTATEAFLLLHCGISPFSVEKREKGSSTFTFDLDRRAHLEERTESESTRTLRFRSAKARLNAVLGSSSKFNYLEKVIEGSFPGSEVLESDFCLARDEVPLDAPCLLELIWSYWMEEGMLNQTIAAITRRFQNVRRAGPGPDPLAELELDPLRPLNAYLWGYLQDEPNRLSVVRRAYEYNHHYGITLYGRAVPALRPADPRSRFLEAFHNLLRQAAAFYREDNDTTVIADAFPVLNTLREVHLLLSEGAHNQFRDLPWQSRVEMLMQQWLLSRPEMREFVRGRYMVAYPEEWMGPVDSMKRMQGWTDTSVLHFRDLARSGERILLSIRYGPWNEAEQEDARSWLRFWRDDVQRYIHAYYTATGVNLSDDVVEVRDRADARYLQPSFHLRNRLLANRRATRQLR